MNEEKATWAFEMIIESKFDPIGIAAWARGHWVAPRLAEKLDNGYEEYLRGPRPFKQ